MNPDSLMNNKKIKVAMLVTHFDVTGIGSVIMNYCEALDHTKYDFTVLAGVPIANQYREACKKYGIHIVALPSRHNDSLKHYWALYRALKNGHFDILHDHGNSSMMAIELTLAKMAGIKIRIAHCHNTRCPNKIIHRLLCPYFNHIYTKAIACGKKAGDWLFGQENFEVLPNGFQTDKFIFSKESRDRIRKELNIEDKFVIGHIGRINDQKNQTYLLKIFEQVALYRENAVLLMVGNGPDTEKIKSMVAKSKYKDQIIMYGVAKNTSAMYSAMDVFVFPSKYEGLPVVLLEAQISGLPCLVSDKVTQEVNFGDIQWASIDDNPEAWAEKIRCISGRSNDDREKYSVWHSDLIKHYDINDTVKLLDQIYTKELNKFQTGPLQVK